MAFNLKGGIVGGLLLACGMIALGVGILRSPGWRPTDLLVAELIREIEQADQQQTLPHMRALASAGEPGVGKVVAMLADQRPRVSSAARTAIFETLDRWRLLKPAESSRRIEHLIAALNKSHQNFGSQARQDAANLATQALLWPVDQNSIDVGALVANCERLLQLTDVAPIAVASRANAGNDNTAPENPTARTLPSAPLLDPAAAILAAPGGELPLEVVALPAMPAPVAKRPRPLRRKQAPVDASEPLQLELGEKQPQPLNPPPARLDPPLFMKRLRAARDSTEKAASQTTTIAAAQLLTDLGKLEIMRLLHDPDDAVATRAASELRRRGFSQNQLGLARRLTTLDQKDRLDFANALPSMTGVDVRPWLLWLSLDESAPVRAAAISLMATSTDPQLLRRIRELANTERNPEILRTIHRVGGR